MGVTVEYSPLVRDVLDDVMRQIQLGGFGIGEEATEAIGELVLSGFRLMQESRILDLPSDSPERVQLEALARANLMRLVQFWMETERAEGGTELSIRGFRRAYAAICPVYPCR